MIDKILNKLADKILEKLPKEKILAEKTISTYSIAKEMKTIHDLEYTQEEKEILRMLQKNRGFKRILEKSCFALSLACVNTKSPEEINQIKAGVRALEFFMREVENNKDTENTDPLTGQPLE